VSTLVAAPSPQVHPQEREAGQPAGAASHESPACHQHEDRAGVVDAQSAGFHVSVVEECVFDRADIPLKSNLFDLAHKYVDVMHLEEVLAHLNSTAIGQAAQ
jgi:hypothetical protein